MCRDTDSASLFLFIKPLRLMTTWMPLVDEFLGMPFMRWT